MTKLHTNFHFLKQHEVDEQDYGIYFFGIFIRTIERYQRKCANRIERSRIRNESYYCAFCEDTNFVRTKNGVKLWFMHNGSRVCPRCEARRRKLSQETKTRMSEQRRSGNPNYGKYGLLNPLFGRKNPRMAGSNNHKWKGGIAELNSRIRTCAQYSVWREKVFCRDSCECKRCGNRKGRKIEAHHIKPFYEILQENCVSDFDAAMTCYELWDIDNGITVCEKCHLEIGKGSAW